MSNDDVHPIYLPADFFIETPMAQKLQDQITSWLWNGLSGGCVLGDYRIGKTSAIKSISSQLVNRLNEPIPSYQISITRRDNQTIAGVFKNICKSLGLKIKPRSTADDISFAVTTYLSDLAFNNKLKQVVLFVDEFQKLEFKQIEVFAELYDSLCSIGINLSVIFIGNTNQSTPLLEKVVKKRNELIRGRFFTHKYETYGVKHNSELRAILKQYDSLKFPVGNGPTYTENFMPEAFKSGWRLEELTDFIWDVYCDQFKSKLPINSWPMQYLTAAIKSLLLDYLPKYGVDDENELIDMIKCSIDASGLIPNIVKKIK